MHVQSYAGGARRAVRTLAGLLLVGGILSVACHRRPNVKTDLNTGVTSLFADTTIAKTFPTAGRTFRLPEQRHSLEATLRRERALWQSVKPRDYRFLLRVGCFCPGTRGWLLIETRSGESLRAWDRTGKAAALTDWNTLSIDGLYDNLERTAAAKGEMLIEFDPRWHFPTYVRTVFLPGPDAWSIIEALALRPI